MDKFAPSFIHDSCSQCCSFLDSSVCWLIVVVQFSEFVNYVLDSWRDGVQLDRHWQPQYLLCRPCLINYDFIGHYETLYQDARIVLDRLQSQGHLKFPRVDPDNRKFQSSSELLNEFYSNLSPDTVQQLLQLYQLDYQLFNYQHPNISNN